MYLPADLFSLYHAADSAAKKFGVSAEGVFDPCGLILNIPPVKDYYWCTPKNALTFASTGGDGVHYSYLDDSSQTDGQTPIVMTLPCADQNNVIIAENFREFFALGYYVGWFALEQLVYQPQDAIEYFSKPDTDHANYTVDRLQFIREALAIRPGPPSLRRIDELRDRYYEMLVIPKLSEET